MGAKGSVRTFENLLGVWVRTFVQLPPSGCMRDGSTLRLLSDTQQPGARQGCKAGRSRARLWTPVSQVTRGRYTNVLQNRRQNRPATAGWQAWSTRTRSLGHGLSLPWYAPRCGPGGQHGPTVTDQRPAGTASPQTGSRGTTCLREQVVSRMPGHEEGSPKKRRSGVMPRIG